MILLDIDIATGPSRVMTGHAVKIGILHDDFHGALLLGIKFHFGHIISWSSRSLCIWIEPCSTHDFGEKLIPSHRGVFDEIVVPVVGFSAFTIVDIWVCQSHQ